jgi:hypothetical protein
MPSSRDISEDAEVWAARLDELQNIRTQQAALTRRRNALGAAFVAALADYERLITEHRLGIDVPCGFRPDQPGEHSPVQPIFWRFVAVDPTHELVHFEHDCLRDHSVPGRGAEEHLTVPLMFFSHREQWLTLAALNALDAIEED